MAMAMAKAQNDDGSYPENRKLSAPSSHSRDKRIFFLFKTDS